jgi:hypothetical protein
VISMTLDEITEPLRHPTILPPKSKPKQSRRDPTDDEATVQREAEKEADEIEESMATSEDD